MRSSSKDSGRSEAGDPALFLLERPVYKTVPCNKPVISLMVCAVTQYFGVCVCSKHGFLLASYNIACARRDIVHRAVNTLAKISRGCMELICACGFWYYNGIIIVQIRKRKPLVFIKISQAGGSTPIAERLGHVPRALSSQSPI